MKTLWFETALLPTGWMERVRVTMAGGVIATVAQADPKPSDERHAIGIPGLCNVHSHGFQRGMAGLSEHRGTGRADDNFWSWREVMYRFLDRLAPDDVEAITALAFAEMLEGGYTRVGEFHYLHNDPDGARYADPAEMAARIVAASDATGIGLTLLPVFYAHSDFGGLPPKPGQRRFLSDLDGFAALLDASAKLLGGDALCGIAPHSLRAVTGEELAALLAMSPAGPVHIHAAEQTGEVEASIAFSGARPVEWLLANADVDSRWCLVHATHLTDAETDGLAASGAVAGLCPVTEANLGDGIFPAMRYLAAGGRIGTGTDSNILIGAADELRAIEYSQRLAHRGRNMLAEERRSTGRRLFDSALEGGARALGVVGGIRPGASADIVSLSTSHVSLADRKGDALLDSWIFSGRAGAIDCVWRAGRRQVVGGRHVASGAIAARYRKTLARILS
ncbi:formimidoylglutamate deiminase [Sphingomonas colocasiae]|uniref:Formimidoylglutamate deiminase n=1 Tax=Sphingomonas colocasiae TaxID=1848973 RepID=A0ABS7PTA2_9SPHN|nr:formimidoylglutamate deiminase [Sphingomonas colocasiae]MBY8824574.1 formimidoylglutamate deiminase [Sphingomonas colocasiae]